MHVGLKPLIGWHVPCRIPYRTFRIPCRVSGGQEPCREPVGACIGSVARPAVPRMLIKPSGSVSTLRVLTCHCPPLLRASVYVLGVAIVAYSSHFFRPSPNRHRCRRTISPACPLVTEWRFLEIFGARLCWPVPQFWHLV